MLLVSAKLVGAGVNKGSQVSMMVRWKNQKKFFNETCGKYDVRYFHSEVHDQDELNRIDARFIDTRNGLYIDITALHSISGGRLSTKVRTSSQKIGCSHCNHQSLPTYRYSSPPVWTTFCAEYGPDALIQTHFNGYIFDRARGRCGGRS